MCGGDTKGVELVGTRASEGVLRHPSKVLRALSVVVFGFRFIVASSAKTLATLRDPSPYPAQKLLRRHARMFPRHYSSNTSGEVANWTRGRWLARFAWGSGGSNATGCRLVVVVPCIPGSNTIRLKVEEVWCRVVVRVVYEMTIRDHCIAVAVVMFSTESACPKPPCATPIGRSLLLPS